MEVMRKRSLAERMLGAALLQIDVYEEVEHDTTATSQAAVVVGIVAVASAIGGLAVGGGGVLSGLIGAYVGWLVWSGVTYFIGTRAFGGTATWGEMLRTIGFAEAPGVLRVFAVIPILGLLVAFLVWIWMLVCGIVAIRQALDFGTGKAVLTAALGWITMVVAVALLGALFGVPLAF